MEFPFLWLIVGFIPQHRRQVPQRLPRSLASNAAIPVPRPRQDIFDADGAEQDGAGQHGGDHVRVAGDQHALAQEAEQQHGDHHARDAALAAEDADAAEHDDGDRAEQQHVAHVGPHRAVIGGKHDAGEGRHHAADHVGGEHDAVDAQPAIARCLAAVADHDDAPAEGAVLQQQREQQGEHGETAPVAAGSGRSGCRCRSG